MGRKVNWPEMIEAPEGAMELYRLIGKLQNSPDFECCHPFKGTVLSQIPHIRFKGDLQNLPKIMCGFLGLIYKRKMCSTKGCANPLHYTAYAELVRIAPVPGPVGVDLNSLVAYVETLRYYIEENDLSNPTLEQLRAIIPAEDISDDLLQQAFENYELQSRNESTDELQR